MFPDKWIGMYTRARTHCKQVKPSNESSSLAPIVCVNVWCALWCGKKHLADLAQQARDEIRGGKQVERATGLTETQTGDPTYQTDKFNWASDISLRRRPYSVQFLRQSKLMKRIIIILFSDKILLVTQAAPAIVPFSGEMRNVNSSFVAECVPFHSKSVCTATAVGEFHEIVRR